MKSGWRMKQSPFTLGLENRYGLDVRSLAVFRISLALVILADLITRSGNLIAPDIDVGVRPGPVVVNEFLKLGNWSLHLISGHVLVQGLLFGLAALSALAMLIGYHTRLAVMASFVLLVSLQNRDPGLIFAADDVLRAMMFWAIFLPLGACYSIDSALNTATKPLPLRVFSGAAVALMVQQSLIYLFPAVFKTASTIAWPEGSAVYASLRYAPDVTQLGRWLLDAPALLSLLTLITVAACWVGPLFLFIPMRTDVFRNCAIISFLLLHLVSGLTLNLGLLPGLSIVTWLVYIPTSVWERWKKRLYGPQQAGLTVYYDADCGFCKKVVHLLRTFLLLPNTPLFTAQSDPSICANMEAKNSWVVVDWRRHRHFKFEAIAYICSLSPVFRCLTPGLRWKPMMAAGTRFYEAIANNRKKAGRFTRPFKFKPLIVRSSLSLNLVASIFLLLTLIWNLHSI